MTGNNLNLNLVNINAYTTFDENLSINLNILNENEMLTSTKGYNSVTDL